MIRRNNKFILSVFILCGSINFCPIVLAAENTVDLLANRSKLEYKSGGLRDPFQTYLIKEKSVKTPDVDLAKMETKFKELRVQGLIWGTKMPQAIINNRIYVVGDKIEDTEILSIDKKGVSLITEAGIVNLAAPGQAGS